MLVETWHNSVMFLAVTSVDSKRHEIRAQKEDMVEKGKPTMLWVCLLVQYTSVNHTPMPRLRSQPPWV